MTERKAYLLLIDEYSNNLETKHEELQQIRLLYCRKYLPDMNFYSSWLTDIVIQIQNQKLSNSMSWQDLISQFQEIFKVAIVDCPCASLALEYIDGYKHVHLSIFII